MNYPTPSTAFNGEMTTYSDSISELMGLVEGFPEDFLGNDVRRLLKDVMRIAWNFHHSWMNLNEIYFNERKQAESHIVIKLT